MLHSEFIPNAFITLTNTGGIEIMLNRSGDGLFYRFNYGQSDLENEYIYDAEIDYVSEEEGEEAEAGFWHYNTGSNPAIFYPLSLAMKINSPVS